jgi:uncharacterized membrane protein YfcA
VIEALDISINQFALIAIAAFFTGMLHGATGMAGGILLTAILSHWIGIKEAVPLMTCVLVFSHASRAYLFVNDTDWRSVKIVLLFGMPMVVVGAIIFTYLHPAVVAGLMAVVLAASFPVKHYAQRKNLKTTPRILAVASGFWGILAGNVIGPGFFLAPFLLGTGINRLTFVGTLASIVLCMNIVKLTVFGAASIISQQALILGIVIGLITMPANWLGRTLLREMTDAYHRRIIEVMTVLIIINFTYLTFTSI